MDRKEIEAVLGQIDDKIAKAVTRTTYTMDPPARSIYSPDNLDPVIKHVVPTVAPVRGILPREKGYGEYASWRRLTSRLDPQAGGTGTRLGFADAGTPSETTQTYDYTTAAYKNIGRDVEIGRQMIAANRNSNLEDVRSHEEMVKSIEVILGEEDITLNGDVATQTTEYNGFAKSFTTNSGSAALLTASGIGVYAQGLHNLGAENPQYLVSSARQNRALADDLQGAGSIQRIVTTNGNDQGSVTGGVHLAQVVNPVTGNMIKYVVSRYSGAYAYLLTVTDPSGEQWLKMSDLEPLSVYDVPDTTHAVKSRVFETTVLCVVAEQFQQKVSGLATS